MKVQRTVTAAMVVLAVSGLVSLGAGSAFADGPQATAGGGSVSEGDLFQQNVAQDGRQNNNCSNINGDEPLDLTGSRLTGRCVTAHGCSTSPPRSSTASSTLLVAADWRGSFNRTSPSAGGRTTTVSTPTLSPLRRPVAGWRDTARTRTSPVTSTPKSRAAALGQRWHRRRLRRPADRAVRPAEQQLRQPELLLRQHHLLRQPHRRSLRNKDASHSKHTWDESGGAEANGGEADSSESQGAPTDELIAATVVWNG